MTIARHATGPASALLPVRIVSVEPADVAHDRAPNRRPGERILAVNCLLEECGLMILMVIGRLPGEPEIVAGTAATLQLHVDPDGTQGFALVVNRPVAARFS